MARKKALSVNAASLTPWLQPIAPGEDLTGKAVMLIWSTPARSTAMQYESQESFELAQLTKPATKPATKSVTKSTRRKSRAQKPQTRRTRRASAPQNDGKHTRRHR